MKIRPAVSGSAARNSLSTAHAIVGVTGESSEPHAPGVTESGCPTWVVPVSTGASSMGTGSRSATSRPAENTSTGSTP